MHALGALDVLGARKFRSNCNAALATCAHAAMTGAPQRAMCWRLGVCSVGASCDDSRPATCDTLVSARVQYPHMLRCRPHLNLRCVCVSTRAMYTQIAMTVTPQPAPPHSLCECIVHAMCDDGRTANCNVSAILNLQSAHATLTVAQQLASC